jgi:hypothetical protein
MAKGQSQVKKTYTGPAYRDLSAYQYHAVTLDTNGYIDYCDTSATTQALGILQNKPTAQGQEAEVAIAGTSLMVVNATTDISQMDNLGSGSDYHGVAVTADKALYFAFALEDATEDGDIIEVLLCGGTRTISTT